MEWLHWGLYAALQGMVKEGRASSASHKRTKTGWKKFIINWCKISAFNMRYSPYTIPGNSEAQPPDPIWLTHLLWLVYPVYFVF